MQLSIVVPVYNVEQYIRSCVESIYRQELDENDFEVILVNDGTQDNSFVIIEDIISNHTNITVIEQRNQGLSVARNTGLQHAKGEYVLFVDSDDLLIESTLKPLLDGACNSSVDMAMGNFQKLTDEQIDTFVPVPSPMINAVQMSGEDAFIHFLDPRECYVWRILFRRKFLFDNHISFLPGIYFEDVPFTTECYIKADKCLSLPIAFYIYRQQNPRYG